MSEPQGHSAAGRSIIEMLWEQADIKYDAMLETFELFEESPKNLDRAKEFYNAQGQLQGLVYALAKMLYTYEPTKEAMDKVKDLLRERWEDAEEEE